MPILPVTKSSIVVKLAVGHESKDFTPRRTIKRFVEDEPCAQWTRNLLLDTDNSWLFAVVRRHPNILDNSFSCCLIQCGNGYDILLLLNNTELPDSIEQIPRISVSICVATELENRGFVETNPLDVYGALCPADSFQQQIMAEMQPLSNCRIFLDSSISTSFGSLFGGSLENKYILRCILTDSWMLIRSLELNVQDHSNLFADNGSIIHVYEDKHDSIEISKNVPDTMLDEEKMLTTTEPIAKQSPPLVTAFTVTGFNPKEMLLLEKAYDGNLSSQDLKNKADTYTKTDIMAANRLAQELEELLREDNRDPKVKVNTPKVAKPVKANIPKSEGKSLVSAKTSRAKKEIVSSNTSKSGSTIVPSKKRGRAPSAQKQANVVPLSSKASKSGTTVASSSVTCGIEESTKRKREEKSPLQKNEKTISEKNKVMHQDSEGTMKTATTSTKVDGKPGKIIVPSNRSPGRPQKTKSKEESEKTKTMVVFPQSEKRNPVQPKVQKVTQATKKSELSQVPTARTKTPEVTRIGVSNTPSNLKTESVKPVNSDKSQPKTSSDMSELTKTGDLNNPNKNKKESVKPDMSNKSKSKISSPVPVIVLESKGNVQVDGKIKKTISESGDNSKRTESKKKKKSKSTSESRKKVKQNDFVKEVGA